MAVCFVVHLMVEEAPLESCADIGSLNEAVEIPELYEVLHPNPKLAERLQQLQMRDGCKLQVYPPLNLTTN